MTKYCLIIKDVKVIDGTGNPWYKADVAVKNNKIEKIGHLGDIDAEISIDGTGLVLSPGFIDMHGHSDLEVFFKPSIANKLEQGVTTEISGFCGLTFAPVSKKYFSSLKKYLGFDKAEEFGLKLPQAWPELIEFGKYMTEVDKLDIGPNLAFYVGQGTIRIAVMGYENRKATTAEMKKMKNLVREAMQSGALGLSTGLIYAPGVYTDKEEIIELCKVVNEYGGSYASHIRNESHDVINAVKEAIDIGKHSGTPVIISHHKIAGKSNWGKSKDTLQLIDQANQQDIEVALDQYPYKAGRTSLAITIPPEYHEGGLEKLIQRLKDKDTQKQIKNQILNKNIIWENMIQNCGFNGILMSSPVLPEVNGKTIEEYAIEKQIKPFEALFDILIRSEGNIGASYFLMEDEDIERIMQHPYTMIGSDSAASAEHPRCTGTFTKVLGHYVREKKILRLEDAIRKMTSLPALKAGLKKKGLVREGYDADLVLFDAKTIKDNADYYYPAKKNEGIKCVIVNGKIAVKDNIYTGITAGKVLRVRE